MVINIGVFLMMISPLVNIVVEREGINKSSSLALSKNLTDITHTLVASQTGALWNLLLQRQPSPVLHEGSSN